LALKGNVNRKGDKKRSLKEEGLVVCALFSLLIMAPTTQKYNFIAAHAIHQTVLLIDTPRIGINFAFEFLVRRRYLKRIAQNQCNKFINFTEQNRMFCGGVIFPELLC